MGQKVTQYPNNVSTNPDDLSLLDLSEKTGLSTYQSRKWTLIAFKTWVNSWVVATSVAWNNITGKPNVVDTTGGTVNYISKFTDENTIGDSLIQDDGISIGINAPIIPQYTLTLEAGSSHTVGAIFIHTAVNGSIAITGANESSGSLENVGVYGNARGSSFLNTSGRFESNQISLGSNIGVYARAVQSALSIGLFAKAEGGVAYAVQLQDGSEGIGKFLKSMTSDGKSKWANILTSDITEDTKLFFTEARVRQSILTGLSVTGSTILSTDSILVALGKLQNQLNTVSTAMIYQGTWDANTNTPTLASGTGTKGFVYRVNVSGSTDIDGITDWKAGDFIVFNGTTWDKWDATDAVTSVNGYTGVVTLGKTDVGLSNVVNTDTTTTANITDSSNKRFVTDAQLTVLGNTSGTNTGDQDLSSYATKDLTLDRKTASYTLVSGDNNKLIEYNSATPVNNTIDSGVFTAGNQILVSQYGAGQVTFVAGSGVTLRSPSGKLKLTGQYSLATIIAISATEFYISGDLKA
jgi:hypothetical protein